MKSLSIITYSFRQLALLWMILFFCVAQSAVSAQILIHPQRPDLQGLTNQSTLTPLRSEPSKDALLFKNGDLFYGALEKIELPSTIQWQRPDVAQPIEFNPEGIAEVHFRPRPSTNQPSAQTCRVRLTNDDEIQGELVSCDTNRLVLNTWYAGQLTIPVDQIQLFIPVPPQADPVFAGPVSIENWISGDMHPTVPESGQWHFSDGAFYATNAASIARDLQLPPVARIQFEIAWKDALNLAIALYTDYMHPIRLQTKENEPPFSDFYSLQINNYTANLLLVSQSQPLNYLGQAIIPNISHQKTAQIEILANLPQKTILLVIDGKPIKQWTDPNPFKGTGTGIRLVHQGQGSIRLHNILVSPWDGRFGELPPVPAGRPHDIALLRNGDQVSGAIQSISDGIVTMSVADSTLDIPWDRLRQVSFSWNLADRPPLDPADVRIHIGSEAILTCQLESWTTQQALASSLTLNKITLEPTAFERILFNPAPPQ